MVRKSWIGGLIVVCLMLLLTLGLLVRADVRRAAAVPDVEHISTDDAPPAAVPDVEHIIIDDASAAPFPDFEHTIIDDAPPATQRITDIQIGDLDGDNQPDIWTAGRGGGSSAYQMVWYKNPAWTRYEITPGDYKYGALGDLDGDEDLDIVACERNDLKVYWFENTGDPQQRDWPKYYLGVDDTPDAFFVGDVDKDGRQDVVYLFKDSFGWAENPSDPHNTWATHTIWSGTTRTGGALADIDEDADLDVLYGNAWWENPLPGGDPTNASQWTMRTIDADWTTEARGEVADLSGDGRPDVVLTGEEDASGVAWYEAPADPHTGTWTKNVVVSTGYEGVHSLALADFDRDGDLDIFAAEMHHGENPDKVTIFENVDIGSNAWVEHILATFGSHNAKAGDLDRDGWVDIVGKNYEAGEIPLRVDLWKNQGGSSVLPVDQWQRHIVDSDRPWQAVFIDGGDLDGDGLPDIVTGGWWYENPGTPGGAWTRHTIGGELYNMAVVHDLDRDGDLDILGTKGQVGSDQFVWAENDGGGGFTMQTNVPDGDGDFLQGARAAQIVVGGNPEVVLSWHDKTSTQMLRVPSPATDPWSWEELSSTTNGEQIAVGDIDDDGDLDIHLGTQWLRNDGGSWTTIDAFDLGDPDAEPDRVELADIDRDGDLDVVVGAEDADRTVWAEAPPNPEDPWTEHLISTAILAMSLDVADLDQDGDIDVVAGEHNPQDPDTGRVFVFQNEDNGSAWNAVEIDSGLSHHDGTQFVDIDVDGDLDILSIGWHHSQVVLYENRAITGSPTPTPTPTATETPTGWTHLSSRNGDLPEPGIATQQTAALILDVDRDGTNDFVIASRREGSSMVWYRRSVAGWTKYLIEEETLNIEAGGTSLDIDGDGDLDIVMGGDSSTNQLWWWQNPYPNYDPDTPWTRREIKNSGATKHHDQIAGDFDGDGQMELVFWNQGDKKLFLADLPADPENTEPWPYEEIFSWSSGEYEGLAKADVDGDGKIDIVGGGRWFEHEGGTSYTVHVIDDEQRFSRAAAVQLVAGGRPEVVFVVGDGVGRLQWYEWTGSAWLGHDLLGFDVDHGHSLQVADVDGDGHQDIFCAEMRLDGGNADAKMWLFLGDSNGNFVQTEVASGFGNHESKVGDLDGDGDLDILDKPYNWDTPRVDVWLNNGGPPVPTPTFTPTPSATPSLTPSPTPTPTPTATPGSGRVTEGLQVLYTFYERRGSIVHDSSRVDLPLHLKISDPGAITWVRGGIRLDASTSILSPGPATKIIDAALDADELTLEAWLRPANSTQSLSRIVALSANLSDRNAILAQNADRYQVRLRTTSTDDSGDPPFESPANTARLRVTHVVYTRDSSGNELFYLNARPMQTGTRTGTFANWDVNHSLVLANDITGDRPWLGELFLVAIYNQALSPAEVAQNFDAGPFAGTEPPPTPTPTPSPTDTISDLITNIVVKSGKTYETDTLAVGQLVYIDRSFVFTSVPPLYQDQEFIRTANDDKSATDADFLTFTLTADATVYVAFDDRATSLPAWLDDGWTYTGDMIDTSDVLRRVYGKSFSAGSVILGGNSMSPMEGARSNYNVIAIAR